MTHSHMSTKRGGGRAVPIGALWWIIVTNLISFLSTTVFVVHVVREHRKVQHQQLQPQEQQQQQQQHSPNDDSNHFHLNRVHRRGAHQGERSLAAIYSIDNEQCACFCKDTPALLPYECPGEELLSITINNNNNNNRGIELVVSDPDRLCTLVLVNDNGADTDGNSIQPVARSYDSHDWEAVAGDSSHSVSFDCTRTSTSTSTSTTANTNANANANASTGVCRVFLPAVEGKVYRLTSFDMPSQYIAAANSALPIESARFLEQATFGPTRATIASASRLADWIHQQQTSTPMTSHRAMFRRHLNGRRSVARLQGAVMHPCQAGARYRRYTFTYRDRFDYVTIQTVPGSNDQKKMLLMNGFVRTVVDAPIQKRRDSRVVFEDGTYEITGHNPNANTLDYSIRLRHPTAGMIPVEFGRNVITNPPINFTAGVEPNVLLIDILSSNARPIDSVYFQRSKQETFQEFILTQDLSNDICSSLREPGIPPNPVFAFYDGKYWIHDPRWETIDNTLESPSPDGGGSVLRATANMVRPEDAAMCANVPRTFVNQDFCRLSTNACAIGTRMLTRQPFDGGDNIPLPSFYLQLTPATLRDIYNVTAASKTGSGDGIPGESAARYVYSVDGLRIHDDRNVNPPCQRGTVSRWFKVNCTGSAAAVNPDLHAIFQNLLAEASTNNNNSNNKGNEFILDIRKTTTNSQECPEAFMAESGFEIQATADDNTTCWLNVHPDNGNVYDFTIWTVDHPGNIPPRNPIMEFASSGKTVLTFPDWHPMSRWQNNKAKFGLAGRLYDWIHYYELPVEVRSFELSEHFGFQADDILYTPTDGAVVCGSPDEVSNDPLLGGSILRGALDSFSSEPQTTPNDDFARQKQMIWTKIVLESEDQLRQRMAWALSQILAITPSSTTNGPRVAEDFLAYYDIFVRRAFGNYRQVLKEVAHSPVMAQMLTYWRSTSTASTFERSGNVQFPDENFAREVMQLFTTGLVKLHKNGTEILDGNGDAIRVYTNDDILEYARVWTGFIGQPLRGNIEIHFFNAVDPMTINVDSRDPFPKMGLDRTYVGDHVPLCVDLPEKHFLMKGAKYILLGRNNASPELHRPDPALWKTASNAQRLTLSSNGPDSLFSKLCGSVDPATCTFPATIVLDKTLSCTGQECNVDTLRTVEVANGVFYEYIRPPCVYQAFFNNGRLAVRKRATQDMTCADPRVQIASAACCNGVTSEWRDVYWGERVSFDTVSQRCGEGNYCSRNLDNRPSCRSSAVGEYCRDNSPFWSNDACVTRVKIDGEGKVGIVHTPLDYPKQTVHGLVDENTVTFFRVDWAGGDVNSIINACDAVAACYASTDGMCICDVTVSDDQVFEGTSIPSRYDVLTLLHTGAFDPRLSGRFTPSGASTDVIWFDANGGALTKESVFEVTDDKGFVHFRKNLKSTVTIVGTGLSFRNPVHYISLTEGEVRDAHHETDAALEHYITHNNTAPFLAIRLAKRFGISNPSPRYVEAIANAFTDGMYFYESSDGSITEYGSGKYGDLAATVACILLDREARSLILDADPSHGSIKEPLIKLIGLMRSLEFTKFDDVAFVDFNTYLDKMTGQMAHAIPNVFSFFLPEYSPPGPLAEASLTAPEAQVLTGPRVIDTMNGFLSLIKFGLTKCFGGFGVDKNHEQPACAAITPGEITDGSRGTLRYLPADSASSRDVTDELATLLTAGRLSEQSRQVIHQVMDAELDPKMKLLKAQQLVVFTPEFHSTNIPRRNGESRPAAPEKTPPSNPYKAVIYLLMEGGMDSFNMLVPHTCEQRNSANQTLREQYADERTSLALTDEERLRVIDATGQPCSQFVVHPELEVVQQLYNAGDLAFFANTGVINKPSTKDNYNLVTETQLFAHNAMQFEAQRIDPFDGVPRTGFLGRMSDVLNNHEYNAQPITIEDATVATVGTPGAGTGDPLIVSPSGTKKFNARPASDTFDPRPFIDRLNGGTVLQSSLYGETWSRSLHTALQDNEALLSALSSSQLATTDFPSDNDFEAKLKAVATLIASHQQRGVDRDVIFLSMGPWDHHADMKAQLAVSFRKVNGALSAFAAEMKAQGKWDSVVLTTASDFGRTLTANSGEGSDHGWGGHYFAVGGAVKGGRIWGEYPDDITDSGPLNVGRGRIMPTMSWESIFNSVLQWMGVPDDELDYCLPNRKVAGAPLLTKNDVFQ